MCNIVTRHTTSQFESLCEKRKIQSRKLKLQSTTCIKKCINNNNNERFFEKFFKRKQNELQIYE